MSGGDLTYLSVSAASNQTGRRRKVRGLGNGNGGFSITHFVDVPKPRHRLLPTEVEGIHSSGRIESASEHRGEERGRICIRNLNET